MDRPPSLEETLARLRRDAHRDGHRRLVVLSGAEDASHFDPLAAALGPAPLWVTSRGDAPAAIPHLHPRQGAERLGSECSDLILDLTAPCPADALGALVGAVRAGGLILLLTPPWDLWSTRGPDPFQPQTTASLPGEPPRGRAFLTRFIRCVDRASDVTRIDVSTGAIHPALTPDLPAPAAPPPEPVPLPFGALTPDQAGAVAAILKVARGRRRRPLVLTADRGRGKSAALGLAAAQLMAAGPIAIRVVAPRPAAIAPLLKACRARLGLPKGGAPVTYRGATLTYLAPTLAEDALGPADLLFVDEAAALPVPLLTRLLTAHGRAVFATTLHGYEGTGQGFRLRFKGVLDSVTPGWRALHLDAPIRWRPGCPVEAFVADALLLNAEAPADLPAPNAPAQLAAHSGAELATDDGRLSAVFGLLVDAHYRTTPADLQRLLDSPGALNVTLEAGGAILGAAVILPEGPLPGALAREIYGGRRRIPGQLLPQTLLTHLGLRGAGALRGARILRIAVHPERQGQGLGTQLLEGVANLLVSQGFDYVGTAFGASAPLLRFWGRGGLWPARIGVQRGKSSGLRSAVLLRPLSAQAKAVLGPARGAFARALPYALGRALGDLDPDIALALLGMGGGGNDGRDEEGEAQAPGLPPEDLEPLAAFAWGPRDGDLIPGALWRLAARALPSPEARALLGEGGARRLLRTALQGHPWQEIAREDDLGGAPGAKARLAEDLRPLLLAWGGAELAEIVADLSSDA